MQSFIVNYFKWAMNVVIKIFCITCIALVIMMFASMILDVDMDVFAVNDIYGIASNFVQHFPHIGMAVDGLLKIVGAAGTPISQMSGTIYSEVLLCCIYMIIIRCFSGMIETLSRAFRRYMEMNKVVTVLADFTVYSGAYLIAFLMAQSIYAGVVRKFSADIACWVIGGLLIGAAVMFSIIGKKKWLEFFLRNIVGGVADVVQLVLIYAGTMCAAILTDANAVYLTNGESAALTACVFFACLFFAIIFTKRLLGLV